MSWPSLRWLLVLAVGVVGAVVYPFPPWAPPVAEGSSGAAGAVDLEVYAAVVEGLRAGGSYHDVLATALREAVFPMRPVFNWRTPLHLSVVASFPSQLVAAMALGALALAAAVPWIPVLDRAGRLTLTLGLALLVLTYLPLINTGGVLFAEVWCGVFLLGALGLRALGRPGWSLVPALLALLFRELAAPWIVVLAALDLTQRRRGMLVPWLVFGGLFATYYGWHVLEVFERLRPTDVHERSWVAGGGPTFVLATLHFFGPVRGVPRAAALVVAVLVALAFQHRRGPLAALSVGWLVWAAFLTIVGQPFNTYWGCVAAPSLAVLLAQVAGVISREPSSRQSVQQLAQPMRV